MRDMSETSKIIICVLCNDNIYLSSASPCCDSWCNLSLKVGAGMSDVAVGVTWSRKQARRSTKVRQTMRTRTAGAAR